MSYVPVEAGKVAELSKQTIARIEKIREGEDEASRTRAKEKLQSRWFFPIEEPTLEQVEDYIEYQWRHFWYPSDAYCGSMDRAQKLFNATKDLDPETITYISADDYNAIS